jgi:hypothetical protein
MVGRRHTGIPRLGLLRPPGPLGARSLFELIGKLRTFFRAAGVAAGLSASLSSPNAEIEEVSGQDRSISHYSGSASTDNLIINFEANNYIIFARQSDKLYSPYSALHSGDEFDISTARHRDKSSGQPTKLDNFGEIVIPATTWSLDISTNQFDGVSDEFGSEIGIKQNTKIWRTRELIGLWTDNNADVLLDTLQGLLQQFIAPSCDGRSPENIDLADCNATYTDTGDLEIRQYNGNSSGTIAPNYLNTEVSIPNPTFMPIEASNRAFLPIETSIPTSTPIQTSNLQTSNFTSTFVQEHQPGTVHDLSPLMPAGIRSLVLQGHLARVGTPPDQCDDISAPCWTSQINPPISIIDSPLPMVDSPTPRRASSVPETSTWMMMLIGFGIMFVACRRRGRNPFKQDVVDAFGKIVRKYFTITLPNRTLRVTDRQ